MKALLLLPLLIVASYTDDPCADNPYSNPTISAPGGPFLCPEGTFLNWDCVEAAQDEYEKDVEAAYATAEEKYDQCCTDLSESKAWCLSDLYICLETPGTTTEQCNNSYELCVEEAEYSFYLCSTAVDSALDTAVAAAEAEFWASVADCCEEQFALQMTDDGEPCSDDVNPYVGLTVNVPYGPIHCPSGLIDWDCVADAEEAYNDAVDVAAATAADSWRAACEAGHAAYDVCWDALAACIEANPDNQACLDGYAACMDTATALMQTDQQTAEDSFQDAVDAATDQYWADVANCCEEF